MKVSMNGLRRGLSGDVETLRDQVEAVLKGEWYDGEGQQGPECMGCGATAHDADTWNRRTLPEGAALVPIRATDRMKLAAWKVWEGYGDVQGQVWKAMLAAAPNQEDVLSKEPKA